MSKNQAVVISREPIDFQILKEKIEALDYKVLGILGEELWRGFWLFFVFLLIALFSLIGCESTANQETEINHKFITVEANEEDKIVIETEKVTSTATFVNYETEGVIIQFIVVRGTDGVVRIAFNTCQACNPSPNAYFIQEGEYLECQNCKNKFHIDQIGEEVGGCNPAPVIEKEETSNQIILDKSYVDTYIEKFENWNGPTK